MQKAKQLKKIGLGILATVVYAFLMFHFFAALTRPNKTINYAFVGAEADNVLYNCFIKFRAIPNTERIKFKDCNQVFRFFQLPETTLENQIRVLARKYPPPGRYYSFEVRSVTGAKQFLNLDIP